MQLLAVGVLARTITSVHLTLSVPFLVLASTVAINALKLWLVGLLSEWTAAPLRIDGPLSLTALAILVTALAWLAVRPRRTRQAVDAMAHEQVMQAMQMHQTAVDQAMWGPYR
jgi:hypothetical protein